MKRQEDRKVLSILEIFDRDVLICGAASSASEFFVFNSGLIDQEFTVNIIDDTSTANDNMVSDQTLIGRLNN